MPRGVYPRKKKTVGKGGGERSAEPFYQDLLVRMRARRELLVDEVTALGTAIDALEVLEKK